MLKPEPMEVDPTSNANKMGESSSRAKGDDDDDEITPLSMMLREKKHE